MTHFKVFRGHIPLGGWIQKGSNAIDRGIKGVVNGRTENDAQQETAAERLQRNELEFTTKFMANMKNATVAEIAGMEALYQKYMPEIYENRLDTKGREIDGTSKADMDGRFSQGELRNLGELRHRIQHGILPEPKPVAKAAATSRQEPTPVREVDIRGAAKQPDQQKPDPQEPAAAKAYPAGEREELVSGPLPEETDKDPEQGSAQTYPATEPPVFEATPIPPTETQRSDAATAKVDAPETPVVPKERMAIEGSGISVEKYDTQVAELQRALIAANPEYKDTLGYTDKQGNRVIVDGFEGPRTREVVEDYAAKHDLGDPRELKIDDVIEHAEKQALAADYDPSTHHYVEAIALKGQLKAEHDLAVERRAELKQEVDLAAKQNMDAVNQDLDESMAYKPDVDEMKEQLAASIRPNLDPNSPDSEMVADNQTTPPPSGPGLS